MSSRDIKIYERLRRFTNELMTSFSLEDLGVAATSDPYFFAYTLGWNAFQFSLRGKFIKLWKSDLKFMRFSRNVNLHRLRNKFNFFVLRKAKKKFSRLQSLRSSSFVLGYKQVWRYLWTKQIDDFDYNIWLKHQNKYETHKEWRIFASMAICQTFKKGEARFISCFSFILRRRRFSFFSREVTMSNSWVLFKIILSQWNYCRVRRLLKMPSTSSQSLVIINCGFFINSIVC